MLWWVVLANAQTCDGGACGAALASLGQRAAGQVEQGQRPSPALLTAIRAVHLQQRAASGADIEALCGSMRLSASPACPDPPPGPEPVAPEVRERPPPEPIPRWLEGTVRGPERQPVPGARVTLQVPHRQPSTPLPLGMGLFARATTPIAATTAGPDGEFRFDPVPEHPNARAYASGPMVTGDPTGHRDLRASRRIRVETPDGLPAPGAFVVEAHPHSPRTHIADSDGVVWVPARRSVVATSADGTLLGQNKPGSVGSEGSEVLVLDQTPPTCRWVYTGSDIDAHPARPCPQVITLSPEEQGTLWDHDWYLQIDTLVADVDPPCTTLGTVAPDGFDVLDLRLHDATGRPVSTCRAPRAETLDAQVWVRPSGGGAAQLVHGRITVDTRGATTAFDAAPPAPPPRTARTIRFADGEPFPTAPLHVLRPDGSIERVFADHDGRVELVADTLGGTWSALPQPSWRYPARGGSHVGYDCGRDERVVDASRPTGRPPKKWWRGPYQTPFGAPLDPSRFDHVEVVDHGVVILRGLENDPLLLAWVDDTRALAVPLSGERPAWPVYTSAFAVPHAIAPRHARPPVGELHFGWSGQPEVEVVVACDLLDHTVRCLDAAASIEASLTLSPGVEGIGGTLVTDHIADVQELAGWLRRWSPDDAVPWRIQVGSNARYDTPTAWLLVDGLVRWSGAPDALGPDELDRATAHLPSSASCRPGASPMSGAPRP